MIKNPGEDYSGISNPGWRASTINEMEGFRFPDQLLATHGSPALLNVDSRGQRDSGGFVSWKFLSVSYNELAHSEHSPTSGTFHLYV